ncbi:MAG: ribonuclease P protein component [Desulfobacterales bacterium]|nr:ribonuclease P protein component [Desulfobacterales bacterium]
MPRFTFARSDRIRKRWEFIRLSKIGKAAYNQHFVALLCPGRGEKTCLGITASRKVGNAVARNRVKRLIREYFRQNRQNISGVWDINIIVKKEAARLPSERTFSSLKNIFSRISRNVQH